MSSRNPLPQHPLDHLIATALRDEVADAQPSPAVWKRTRRRALSWLARTQPQAVWNGTTPFSPMPLALGRGLIALHGELSVLRFWEYAGMLLRFGW